MIIELKPINEKNINAVLNLKVADNQKTFICSNAHTISYCYIWPSKIPLSVYSGDEVVGLVAYEQESEAEYDILTMMIDADFQGMGYGKAAFTALLELLKSKPECKKITLNHQPDNVQASAFYHGFGFKETGEEFNGEIILELVL